MSTSNIGGKIVESRKKRGVKAATLSEEIGVSASTMSLIENDQLKGGPDPDLVIRIAEVLNDDSILLYYIENNPVYKHILPKIFPDLNNIRREPAIIFTRLAGEAKEAMEASRIMAELFSNADPTNTPNFEAVFRAKMEQVVDIKRAVEILEFELMACGVITKQWLQDVYGRQQLKCEANGHHKAEIVSDKRVNPDRRENQTQRRSRNDS